VLLHGREGVGLPCAAGRHSLNGSGETTGTAWIEEAGAFSGPVLVTNTHAVGLPRTVLSEPQRIADRVGAVSDFVPAQRPNHDTVLEAARPSMAR
jgi:L-aminopeptidase/D-esterase-like protein